MNVWYRTDKTPDDYIDESGANATLSDGHENPWLSDEATASTLGEDGRAVDFTGWKLWRADVPTTEATELAVADLGLEEGEHVTAIRFEYGRVEQGFTTRDGGWDREGIKDVHDDIASAEDTAAENGSDTDDSGTGTGTALCARHRSHEGHRRLHRWHLARQLRPRGPHPQRRRRRPRGS